jgi:hypothetical protein
MDVHPVLRGIAEVSQPQLPRSGPDGQPDESSHLERFTPCWKQFCFAGGEAIRQERREARCGASGERLDEAGARRPKTRMGRALLRQSRRKSACPDRQSGRAAFLDLVAKSLRQNDSNKA